MGYLRLELTLYILMLWIIITYPTLQLVLWYARPFVTTELPHLLMYILWSVLLMQLSLTSLMRALLTLLSILRQPTMLTDLSNLSRMEDVRQDLYSTLQHHLMLQ